MCLVRFTGFLLDEWQKKRCTWIRAFYTRTPALLGPAWTTTLWIWAVSYTYYPQPRSERQSKTILASVDSTLGRVDRGFRKVELKVDVDASMARFKNRRFWLA
jgi:hypothetical protein